MFSSEVYRVYNGSAFLELTSFLPIKELIPDDGDMALVFLSANRVYYFEAVEDDWYAAHRQPNDSLMLASTGQGSSVSSSTRFYLADEPASVLGCKMSYQTCDPTVSPENGCTPVSGSTDLNFSIKQPRTRRDRLIRWIWSAGGLDTYFIVSSLKESSLTSRFRLLNQFQGSLPADQWQLEVENWHNITLATYQGLIVDAAAGPGDAGMLKTFWTPPNNTEEKYLCQNQVCLPCQRNKAQESDKMAADSKNLCVMPLSDILSVPWYANTSIENYFHCLRQFLPVLAYPCAFYRSYRHLGRVLPRIDRCISRAPWRHEDTDFRVVQ